MGTAELACASLEALLAAGSCEIAAVVTQPDRPKGRDLKPQPPPVKITAEKAGLRILQPESAREAAFVSELAALRADVIIVAAYGQILRQAALDLPRLGCLNVHASLLPKYRGAAPIQWAILDNEPLTGVTIMKMDAGLDTGGILARRAIPIDPDETAAGLHHRLAVLGGELLVATLPAYAAGAIIPQPQEHAAATYARKITKADGRLDWTRPALTLRNQIRAFTPWPGACVDWPAQGRPRLLKIWRAQIEAEHGKAVPGQVIEAGKNGLVVACGTGALRIEELQLEGGRKMAVAEFLAGHDLKPGASLAAANSQ
jgi:methionyl-tRNA formyltransferase